jgi:hypothetical protein
MSLAVTELVRVIELYQAGAHYKAIARALGRDRRTILHALKRERMVLRQDPPLPRHWRAGLSPVQIAALEAYQAQLDRTMAHAWSHLQRKAATVSSDTYTFASEQDYCHSVQTVAPPEAPEVLAQRLGVELTRVLLAYAERVQQYNDEAWC